MAVTDDVLIALPSTLKLMLGATPEQTTPLATTVTFSAAAVEVNCLERVKLVLRSMAFAPEAAASLTIWLGEGAGVGGVGTGVGDGVGAGEGVGADVGVGEGVAGGVAVEEARVSEPKATGFL